MMASFVVDLTVGASGGQRDRWWQEERFAEEALQDEPGACVALARFRNAVLLESAPG